MRLRTQRKDNQPDAMKKKKRKRKKKKKKNTTNEMVKIAEHHKRKHD
jgi:hypothetical protein